MWQDSTLSCAPSTDMMSSAAWTTGAVTSSAGRSAVRCVLLCPQLRAGRRQQVLCVHRWEGAGRGRAGVGGGAGRVWVGVQGEGVREGVRAGYAQVWSGGEGRGCGVGVRGGRAGRWVQGGVQGWGVGEGMHRCGVGGEGLQGGGAGEVGEGRGCRERCGEVGEGRGAEGCREGAARRGCTGGCVGGVVRAKTLGGEYVLETDPLFPKEQSGRTGLWPSAPGGTWCVRLHTVWPLPNRGAAAVVPGTWERHMLGRLRSPWHPGVRSRPEEPQTGCRGQGAPGPSRTDLAAVGQMEMAFPLIKPDTTHLGQEFRQG